MTWVATLSHKIVLISLFMCPLKDKWTVATLCLWWRVYSWLTTCNNLQQLYFRWTLSTPSQRMVSNVLENDLPVSALRWQSYPNEFKSYFPTWEIHLQRIYTQRQLIDSWWKNISDQQVQCDSQRPLEEWSPGASQRQNHMGCFVSLTTASSSLTTYMCDVQATREHLHL